MNAFDILANFVNSITTYNVFQLLEIMSLRFARC